MEQKCGKCWKSPIFEGKLWVFISYLSNQYICSITLLYYSTFCSLFLPFFVLEIFKFKYNKVFVRHSASISKFEWFEQPWSRDEFGHTNFDHAQWIFSQLLIFVNLFQHANNETVSSIYSREINSWLKNPAALFITNGIYLIF